MPIKKIMVRLGQDDDVGIESRQMLDNSSPTFGTSCGPLSIPDCELNHLTEPQRCIDSIVSGGLSPTHRVEEAEESLADPCIGIERECQNALRAGEAAGAM